MKALTGRGLVFILSIFDMCRKAKDYQSLVALMPKPDALKLKATQEKAEAARKADEEKIASIIEKFVAIKEKDIKFEEFLDKYDL